MPQLLFVFAALFAAIQLQPQQPSASLEGIVVKLGTGEPLANATVQLIVEIPGELSGWNMAAQVRRTAKSDPNGRFVFESIPPGEYRLIATYEGEYVPAEYGQRSPTGEGIPFEVVASQKITEIQLAMSPTGAISGRIYDRYGEPLAKAQVFALRPAYKNGRRTLTIVQSAESNDRGEHRLFWLAPGSYYVGALADIPERPQNIPAVRITPANRFGTYQEGSNPVVHKRKLKTGEDVEEMYLPVYYPNAIDMNAACTIERGWRIRYSWRGDRFLSNSGERTFRCRFAGWICGRASGGEGHREYSHRDDFGFQAFRKVSDGGQDPIRQQFTAFASGHQHRP